MSKEIEELIASGVLEVALFKAYGGKEYEAERLMLYRARMAGKSDQKD